MIFSIEKYLESILLQFSIIFCLFDSQYFEEYIIIYSHANEVLVKIFLNFYPYDYH